MIIETYKDENSKEKYFIDSSTIEDLNIRKSQINTQNYGKRKVSLNVKYIPLKKEIKIISSISIDERDYTGESASISSLAFSNALAQAIIKDEVIEGVPLIAGMIDQSLLSLSIHMMSEGIAVQDRIFTGVGYITSKDKKIAVFEDLSIENDGDVQSIHADKCVSSFDLSMAESCSLTFHGEGFVVSTNIGSVARNDLQKLLYYNFISANGLKISKASEKLEPLNVIEGDIDKFIEARLMLLDDISNELDVDELFEDIF